MVTQNKTDVHSLKNQTSQNNPFMHNNKMEVTKKYK